MESNTDGPEPRDIGGTPGAGGGGGTRIPPFRELALFFNLGIESFGELSHCYWGNTAKEIIEFEDS